MTDVQTATPELESQDSPASAPDTVPTVERLAPGTAGTLLDPATADLARPGSTPTLAEATAAGKDRVLTSDGAIALARDSLAQVTEPLSVGEYMAARREGDRVITHLFECNLAGYRGWRWAVTLTRVPRARTATVCEMGLLPGEEALLAPTWVPWADRLQPGDVGRADRLPRRETDERLEPGWEAASDGEGDAVPEGLVLAGTDAVDFGRARVLSAEGVRRAAQRWYDGDHGPQAEGVRKAHATCGSCGFFMPMAGPMRSVFGVCANEWAADDGRVVSLDHGCGAHSETDLPDQGPEWPVTPSRLDEAAMEPIGTDGASLREGAPAQAPEQDADATADDADAPSAGDDASRAGAPSADVDAQEADAPAPQTQDAHPDRQTQARASSGSDADEEAGDAQAATETAGTAETAAAETAGAASARKPRTRRRRSETAAQTPEDETSRHASALDAVADLTAARATGSGRRRAPATLADLEAALPVRD